MTDEASTIGDGVLAEAVARSGVDLPSLVAAATVWTHPDVVQALLNQTGDVIWFAGVRRARTGEGRRVHVGDEVTDDNSFANRAAKLATYGEWRVPGFAVCHLWERSCYDVRCHTALPNLVLIPSALAGLSDHHPGAIDMLRRRSFELYGWLPHGRTLSEQMSRSIGDRPWRTLPDPAKGLAALKRRSTSLPRARGDKDR